MINKDELIEGTLNFINTYERLPYLSDDDIEVEKLNDNNELELNPYRAGKYIKEFFKNQDKYSNYLLQENILTYETISQIINIKINRLKELLGGNAKNVEISERRAIHIFFNKDFYKKLGKLNSHCKNCMNNKTCGQEYWVTVVHCPKFKDSKKK